MVTTILLSFWVFSRYPDLISEYQRSSSSTLLDRNVGQMSKYEAVDTKSLSTNLTRAMTTAFNWFETNKYGMSFGIIFSAAILLLLEQSKFFYRAGARCRLRGVLSGVIIGTPLGVCTNCATPVSLGMKKAGASMETAFATLVASPSLNPIGLAMIFFLFPLAMGFTRTAVIMTFLFLLLPLIIKQTVGGVHQPVAQNWDNIDESWKASLSYCVRRYWQNLKYIILKVLPPMIIIGIVAAFFITYYPLEKLLLANTDSIYYIVLTAIIGSLLPMPMFVDIVIIWLMMSFGLPLSLAMTLLITLAPTSLYAMYVMGKNVSWVVSIAVTTCICLLGIITGSIVRYVTPTINYAFKPMTLNVPKAQYDNKSLTNFFAAGITTIDFDNDGNVDVFIPGVNRLYKNLGDAKFVDVTQKSNIKEKNHSIAAIWGDYDNDGFADLLLVNYVDDKGKPQTNKLYQNNRDGTFSDVTQKVGLTHKDYSSSAAWGDYDNDGDLDLFVSNYGRLNITGPNQITGKSQKDRLYRNDNGKFIDVSKEAGVAGQAIESTQLREYELKQLPDDRGFSFQALWFDYNNDGLIDLFVTADFGVSQLYQNQADGKFKNVTKDSGLHQFATGMGVTVLDFNHDGLLDLYVTTTTNNKLWLNHDSGVFSEQAKKYKLEDPQRTGWGVSTLDYNNQGQQDILIANGIIVQSATRMTVYDDTMAKVLSTNTLLKKELGDIAKPLGLDDFAMARGLALADFNNDGFVDIAISNRQGAIAKLYMNPGSANHSLSIKLIGNKNVFAIGAKVRVYSSGKSQTKLVTAGSSFASQNSRILHFGLGKAPKADKIIITWPDGHTQTLSDVTAGKITIKE